LGYLNGGCVWGNPGFLRKIVASRSCHRMVGQCYTRLSVMLMILEPHHDRKLLHTHIYINSYLFTYLLIYLPLSVYIQYIYICMIQNKKETEQNHPYPPQNLPMRPWGLVLRYLKCRSSHSKLLGPNLAQLQLYPLQILYGGCSPFMITYDNI
jgi:hypothetical protein